MAIVMEKKYEFMCKFNIIASMGPFMTGVGTKLVGKLAKLSSVNF
jgi:hypothetical protein